jgi:hypothetical protein
VKKTTPPPARREKWLAAQSECDGSRHTCRTVQARAAPTAFQRTSLLMKCNTTEINRKSFSRGTRKEENKRQTSLSASFCVFCPRIRPIISSLLKKLSSLILASWRRCVSRSCLRAGAPRKGELLVIRCPGEGRSGPERA